MADGDLADPVDYGSLVRNNLMKRPGYAPYCVAMRKVDEGYVETRCLMPRMRWDGDQFACFCGCRTEFDAKFIAIYKARWHAGTEQSAKTFDKRITPN